MEKKSFVASWSGGKDSAMAFHRAVQCGMQPAKLWTMFEVEGEHSKSHAIPREVVEQQAASLALPLLTRQAEWATYEAQFLDAMKQCVAEGITYGVFGDIDIEAHRQWVQQACAQVEMEAIHPLWLMPRRELLEQFVREGFEAYVIVVHTERMPASFLGRRFTIELMDELEALGIDSCGEGGEFHTIVVDGPIFTKRVPIRFLQSEEQHGYLFLQMTLE